MHMVPRVTGLTKVLRSGKDYVSLVYQYTSLVFAILFCKVINACEVWLVKHSSNIIMHTCKTKGIEIIKGTLYIVQTCVCQFHVG